MPTENQDTLAGIGRLIAGRYRIERKLGGGAMGTVWYATDELLQRPVAVKEVRLAPGMPEEEAAELRERALREARAIAVLSHPNVVTLYDVAREQAEPFVVMELVPSQSLAAILDDHGALDERQLAVIADGVAAGLDAAHRAGIVHRDVKPGNVLIGDDGRLKVSDFGISRNVAEHTLTNTGILLALPPTSPRKSRRARTSPPPPTCGAWARRCSPRPRAARPTTSATTRWPRSPRWCAGRSRCCTGRAWWAT
ncbi:serine/threonine-protein kinase [Saccharopolyspora sp. ID03-671]|uniref:serine/threonine-protein kinase n=1 Tax=Saccharopolyspora sp. ID03-671 TaxID=3073066 RepID=UPI00324D689C